MKSCFLILSLFLVCLATSACTTAITKGPLDRLDWLLGEWEADGGDTVTVEKWNRLSAQTYEGAGQSQPKNSDSVPSRESLRLVEMSGEIFYLAKVEHNELPVAFRLVECSNGRAVFENRGHDFPKRIDYRCVDESTLRVTVSDGGSRRFEIEFRRAPSELD